MPFGVLVIFEGVFEAVKDTYGKRRSDPIAPFCPSLIVAHCVLPGPERSHCVPQGVWLSHGRPVGAPARCAAYARHPFPLGTPELLNVPYLSLL